MKKISKKQKLIIAISIVLLLIILAIVVTSNIISNNRKLASGGYFATTANASSALVAGYIKEGITIGGVTGTLEILDTSDADATPEDIAWGKTGYVNGKKITGTYDNSTLAQLKKSGQAVIKNTTVEDRYNNQIKIPEGFKIADDSPITIPEGVVIEDVSAPGKTTYTKGSQFVWIPVGDVITDTNGSKTTITLGRYTFASNGTATPVQTAENWSQEVAINTYYKELATSSYGNATAKNLEQFISKATTSGGYYIGRYEAGDATATTTARTDSTSDTNPVVCKTGVYPYNNVTQPQASTLARGMYTSSNFDSDLINSYAWDTAIVFIQTFSGDTNYSMQKGKNTKSSIQKCGESVLNSTYLDDGDEAQDVRCNIYDMAGNTCEWPTETYSYTDFPCVYRGGECGSTYFCTSGRYPDRATYSYASKSFRPTLYL